LRRETKIPFLWLLLDINLSVLIYSANPQEYKKYRFYERNHFARNEFLTKYRIHICLGWSFNPTEYRSYFDDKNRFNQSFSNYLGRRWLYAPDASDQQIEDFLREQEQFIVKPCDLNGGTGIYKILLSEIVDIKAFCVSAKINRLMLEEIIKQHSGLSSINPASVNTLRINTVVDKKGVPHILCACLRMGTGQAVADNMSAGGILAQIDLNSGVLFTTAIGKDCQTYIKHPTSGAVLPGFQIPHWEAAKEMVLQAAKVIPQIRFVAWDVAVTEKGPLLIEGNTMPGTEGFQLATQTGVYRLLRSYL